MADRKPAWPWFPAGPETPYAQLVRELSAGLHQMQNAEREAGAPVMHEITCGRCREKGTEPVWADYGSEPRQLIANLGTHISRFHPEALQGK